VSQVGPLGEDIQGLGIFMGSLLRKE